MAYQSLLRLELLPKEDFIMLKELVEKYQLEGSPSEVYSVMFGALINLCVEVGMMKGTVIEDGERYMVQVMQRYIEG